LAIIDKGVVIAEGTPSELKDKVGGDRITLRIREFTDSEEAEKAKNILQSLPFVEEVIINVAQGNALNLIVKPGNNSLSKIEQSLAEIDLPTFSLAQSRPSLDDVYLAATGQTIMDAELAAIGTRDWKQEKKQQMK
jgi:ABC-2 type transport system ATP-binding protein